MCIFTLASDQKFPSGQSFQEQSETEKPTELLLPGDPVQLKLTATLRVTDNLLICLRRSQEGNVLGDSSLLIRIYEAFAVP